MHWLKRSYFGWGESAADYANPKLGLVVHYDGPGKNLTKRPHDECVTYWKGVRRYHMKEKNWKDLGYSFGVCPHKDTSGQGYVFEGRGLHREQAAQQGGNTTYYSVTLMLGENEKPTDIQTETVRELREYLHQSVGNSNVVKGHKDITETTCPGTLLYKMVKDGTFSKAAKPAPDDKSWPYASNYALGLWDADRTGTRKVQGRLNKLGFKPTLVEDGLFGPMTEKAVRWFQKKVGLKVDGLVGPSAWKAIFR